MRVVLTGRHVEVTPTLRRSAEQKLARIDRLLNDGIVSGQVIFSSEKYRRLVEIVAHARGDHMLRAVAAATTFPLALTDAVEKIAHQAQTVKGKWEVRRRESRSTKRVPVAPVVPSPDRRTRIVRARRYAVKAMELGEAARTVGETPDAFVVFRNPETDAVNVMYRRKGGDLGLIEPEG
jgi:putative sigma-54 modulation protein